MLLEVLLRDADVMMKPGTMMQEVAADQAIMQLMDARGTLMELKVTILPTRHQYSQQQSFYGSCNAFCTIHV